MSRHWFKPKKFWNVFAFYYPASFPGWLLTLLILFFLTVAFVGVDRASHSVSDTLINFAPWFIELLLLYDFFCFRFGEYPAWWKERQNNNADAEKRRN